MRYQSTRDARHQVTASQAILEGLASDGGLYTPVEFPLLDWDWSQWKDASYQEVACRVLGVFLDDFSDQEIAECVQAAYGNQFDHPEIAPLVSLDGVYHLELFHGPTIAFKDMALSILPHLMTRAAQKHGSEKKIVILTATSGDTGKAAMAGFEDVPNTQIIVFYPKDGVSKIQELQMTTQTGDNTHVVAIDGNFDDAQTKVKELFHDPDLREELMEAGFQFSSANSMNIGRLVPQIVYYVWAYLQLVKKEILEAGDPMNVTVPTGNFGNILAAYYAKNIGLPIDRLVCASNANRVLTDFFETRSYDKRRPFYLTTSPSMDILVSSNLERLIFHLVGNDAEKTQQLMDDLTKEGHYQLDMLDEGIFEQFRAGYADEKATSEAIASLYRRTGYVEDPHTAVADAVQAADTEMQTAAAPMVVVSTASPYKFPEVVVSAITGEKPHTDQEAIAQLATLSGGPIPAAVTSLHGAPIRHQTVVSVSEMRDQVRRRLGFIK